MPADKDGVRIAELDERSYREKLWSHRPLTDFWRVGRGIAKRLEHLGLYTMGDVARYSENYEDQLYKEFGVNAELLIDHAWGAEPCTMEYIHSFIPESSSISTGQVLQRPYEHGEAGIVVREMAEELSMQLLEKKMVTDQIVLTINYDVESMNRQDVEKRHKTGTDRYGRQVPEHAHGSVNLPVRTSSVRLIREETAALYERITDPLLTIRRISIAAARLMDESMEGEISHGPVQMDFSSFDGEEERRKQEMSELMKKDRALQTAALEIKKRFGKNAILKGTDLKAGATAIERNDQIGGHKA